MSRGALGLLDARPWGGVDGRDKLPSVESAHWGLAAVNVGGFFVPATQDKEIHLHVGAIPDVAEPGR